MSEIPTLAGEYGPPAPRAGDLLARRHALPPLGALPLVRTPIATLCAAAARMIASATMLIAVAVTVGDEPRAAGVGAASHQPRPPCLRVDCVRGSGRVPRSVTPACGHPNNLGRRGGRRLGGCRRHHEPEPRRYANTPQAMISSSDLRGVPAPAHTRCAILHMVGVTPVVCQIHGPAATRPRAHTPAHRCRLCRRV